MKPDLTVFIESSIIDLIIISFRQNIKIICVSELIEIRKIEEEGIREEERREEKEKMYSFLSVFLLFLNSNCSMNYWNFLVFQFKNDNISNFDWFVVKGEKKDVASIKSWFHRTGKHHDYWTF